MESIANKDSRKAAREKFYEWCEMKESVYDEIEFTYSKNDIAWLCVSDKESTHYGRDIIQRHTGCPIRVIDVRGINSSTIAIKLLLTELQVSNSPEPL